VRLIVTRRPKELFSVWNDVSSFQDVYVRMMSVVYQTKAVVDATSTSYHQVNTVHARAYIAGIRVCPSVCDLKSPKTEFQVSSMVSFQNMYVLRQKHRALSLISFVCVGTNYFV
jgi:hypothetical protein